MVAVRGCFSLWKHNLPRCSSYTVHSSVKIMSSNRSIQLICISYHSDIHFKFIRHYNQLTIMSLCTDPNNLLVTPPNMYVHGIHCYYTNPRRSYIRTYVHAYIYIQWNLFNDPYKEHCTPKV